MLFGDEIKLRAKADGLVVVSEGYDWRADQDRDVILLAVPGKEKYCVACSASGLEQLQNSDPAAMAALVDARYNNCKAVLTSPANA